jgi:hypothetical protein
MPWGKIGEKRFLWVWKVMFDPSFLDGIQPATLLFP